MPRALALAGPALVGSAILHTVPAQGPSATFAVYVTPPIGRNGPLRVCAPHLARTDQIQDNSPVTNFKVDVEKLSTQERLDLLEEIWDSLTPDDVTLTAAQEEELRRRVEDMERDPDQAISWEAAQRRIHDRPQ